MEVGMMEKTAAVMLEAGVRRFQGLSMAALLAEMWAPLAVLILRLRSRGKEVISSHISTYYSSGDDSDSNITEEEEEGSEASSFGEEEKGRWRERRIGYYEGAADNGCFPWGGTVVRTWQDLPHRISGGARLLAP
uniref:Uncharacterized protein n=1 Tax=Oryza rufipogon TaxID=4529 RepID=A0A0E0QII3_ORYRU